jgi:hypothetical protein
MQRESVLREFGHLLLMRTIAPDFDGPLTSKKSVDIEFPGKGSHDLSHHF